MKELKEKIESIIDKTFKTLKEVLNMQRPDIPLIFPKKRDDSVRISEQELRFLFVHFLDQEIASGAIQYNNEPICYSVETPTRNQFSFTGDKKLSGNIDLTIHRRSDHKRICIIEFKCNNVDFESDYDKLHTELESKDNCYTKDAFGYFVQLLPNSNSGTQKSIEDKIDKYKKSERFKHTCYSIEHGKEQGKYLVGEITLIMQDKMTLTIHRGTHEVGGNCVELRTAEKKILIDFGMPLDYDKRTLEEQSQIRLDAAEWCKGVDALFLSHAHADHYGLFDLLPEGTPIYATEETFAMLALDGILGTNPITHLKQCPIHSYSPHNIGGLTATAYPIDHSAYGACAYLFESEGLRVLYSGDVRLHGVKGVLYKKLPSEVDYLLLEGTNIAREQHTPSEQDVEEQFVQAFDDAPYALHLVWCSSRNIDRICALFRACLKRDKTLVIDPYTANVLAMVAKLNPKIPSATTTERIKVYFPPSLTTRLTRRNQERYIYSLNPRANKVTYADISATPERYVMVVRPSVLEFLQKIEAKQIRFVKSIWSGYWEDSKIKRFRSWVQAHCEELPDIHSSGHADIASLRRIVGHIKPKHLVPIHTDSPERFAELFPDSKIILPNDNDIISL